MAVHVCDCVRLRPCVCVCDHVCASVAVRVRVAAHRSRAAGRPHAGVRRPSAAPPVVAQEQKFCQRYDQLMEAWEKKVERIENNPRRRARESKVREYYEKQFPEIRKQRELQERVQR